MGAGKGNASIALIGKDECRSAFLYLEDCSLLESSVGLSFSAFANCCVAAGADDGSFGVLDPGVGDKLLRAGFEVSVGGALCWEPEAIACGAFAGGHLDKRHACLLEIRGGRGSGKSLRVCFSGLGGLVLSLEGLGDSGFASCCLLVSSGVCLSDSCFESEDVFESFAGGSLTVGEVGALPSLFPIEDTALSDAGSPTEDCRAVCFSRFGESVDSRGAGFASPAPTPSPDKAASIKDPKFPISSGGRRLDDSGSIIHLSSGSSNHGLPIRSTSRRELDLQLVFETDWPVESTLFFLAWLWLCWDFFTADAGRRPSRWRADS